MLPLIILMLLVSPDAIHRNGSDHTIRAVKVLIDAGELEAARSLALEWLDNPGIGVETRILLHIELARLLDRIGLHQNTRPVDEALLHIESAAALLSDSLDAMTAAVALARSYHYYRAEMNERMFEKTVDDAHVALGLFRSMGNHRGEADALHRLGLVHLQRRELATARVFFDRSLLVDAEGGNRPAMIGDYERHVGFLYQLAGDWETAVTYFERSLLARKEAGLVDQSMFAAQTYGSALIRIGRADDAHEPLLYAMDVAEKIGSPVGKARTGLALGRLYEARGDSAAAKEVYEMTQRVAISVHYDSVAQLAADALGPLNGPE